MLVALEPYRHKISRSLAASGIPQFFGWWWQELIALLPEQVRAVVDHPPESVWIARDDGHLHLWRITGNEETLTTVDLSEDPEMVRARMPATLTDEDGARLAIHFCLDASTALVKTLSFPEAAEDNLRQVLAFEMDRNTPFKADDVYYDYRVVERNAVTRTVTVQLAVVRRKAVDEVYALCSKRGIELGGIDVASEPLAGDARPATVGVNLLLPEKRARRGRTRLKINLALGAAMVLILFGVMWNSLSQKRADLEQFRERVADVRAEARAVTDLKNELDKATEAAGFLAQRRAKQPALLDVVLVVTHILPDDIWLQRLQIKEDKVSITGHSPDASRVISILEQTPGLSRPGFVGSITPDQQRGTERFTIEVYADPGILRQLASQVEPLPEEPTLDPEVDPELDPEEDGPQTVDASNPDGPAQETTPEVSNGTVATAGR